MPPSINTESPALMFRRGFLVLRLQQGLDGLDNRVGVYLGGMKQLGGQRRPVAILSA